MQKITELSQTVDLMNSKDYKDRFVAEYLQTYIRYNKLLNMYKNWDNLQFTPSCPKSMYDKQLNVMLNYLFILEDRAVIEGIDLDSLVEGVR